MSNDNTTPKANVAIDLGSLGSVEVVSLDENILEVFAKYPGSPYATGGSDFSDDSGGAPVLTISA
jgi:hypothetical protein